MPIFHHTFKLVAIWLSITCFYCLNVTTADTVTTADRKIYSLQLSSLIKNQSLQLTGVTTADAVTTADRNSTHYGE